MRRRVVALPARSRTAEMRATPGLRDGVRGSSWALARFKGGPNWVRTSDLSGVNGALFR